MVLPSTMLSHTEQTPHGSIVGPFSQFNALPNNRAAVVFPTPRGPQNKNA